MSKPNIVARKAADRIVGILVEHGFGGVIPHEKIMETVRLFMEEDREGIARRIERVRKSDPKGSVVEAYTHAAGIARGEIRVPGK